VIYARVGLSAVLGQAARLLPYAIEPLDDDTQLIVGIEKANAATRSPAAVYRKVPGDHSLLPEKVWRSRRSPTRPVDDPAVA
jgi:hypothetical protein